MWKLYKACFKDRLSAEVKENQAADCQRKSYHLKTLAISKVIHLELVTNSLTKVINDLSKTQN